MTEGQKVGSERPHRQEWESVIIGLREPLSSLLAQKAKVEASTVVFFIFKKSVPSNIPYVEVFSFVAWMLQGFDRMRI